jgi:hypothetical protein
MITAPIFLLIKVAAAIGGAIIGYLASGPVIRLLYRLAAGRPAPGWFLPLGRLAGAALLGALFFMLATLGGNGLGWGGSGLGLGAGPGAGPGAAKNGQQTGKPGIGKGDKATREKLVIELLGGNRVAGDQRYYLLGSAEPAKTLGEVEEVIKNKADKLEVHVKFTDESVAASHPAVKRLHELLQRYQVPTVTPTEN